MPEYTVEQNNEFNIDAFLKNDLDFKTLYNIEFASDEENIKLLKRICLYLYHKVESLERSRR